MWSRFPWNIHITKSLFPFHVNFPVAKAISCTYRISQSSISCANLFPFLPFRFFCPFLLVVFFFCSLSLMTQLWQGGVAMKGEGCGWPGHLLTGPGAKIEWKKKEKKLLHRLSSGARVFCPSARGSPIERESMDFRGLCGHCGGGRACSPEGAISGDGQWARCNCWSAAAMSVVRFLFSFLFFFGWPEKLTTQFRREIKNKLVNPTTCWI